MLDGRDRCFEQEFGLVRFSLGSQGIADLAKALFRKEKAACLGLLETGT
ncbi:MAG: hypothetical protein IPN48_05400 [Sphingomonadales bacterium]|nr:hypothetical protein [Sphingomonadales bacterium]